MPSSPQPPSIPGIKWCRRRSRRRIRIDTKKRVKSFLNLKSLDASCKQQLLKSFRHRAVQLAEAQDLRKRLEGFLVPLVLLFAMASLVLAPIIFYSKSSKLGFRFDLNVDGLADKQLAFLVLTVLGALLIAVAPLFIITFLFIGSSQRIRGRFVPPAFISLVTAISVVFWIVALSNILFAARVSEISLERQVIAIFLVGLIAYFISAFFLAFVASSLMYFFDRRAMKVLADAFIIHGLVSALISIERSPVAWVETEFKRNLIVKIEKVADCISIYLPNRLRSGDIATDSWAQETANQMATGVRSLIRWIYTPKIDTRDKLVERLAQLVVHAVRGDWDSFEKLTSEKISRPDLLRDRVKAVVIAFCTGAVPILLIYFIKYLNLIDGAILKPILIVGYLWAAVTVLSQLDPLFGAKLSTIKDLTQWLPFTGKSDKT